MGGREENWNRQRGHHIPIDRGDYFAWHNYVDKRSVQVQVFVIMDNHLKYYVGPTNETLNLKVFIITDKL